MSYLDTPRAKLTRIGPWDLGHTLGRGAYAHVRLATHVVSGHQAACKILPALHGTPGIPVDWDATLDAVEAHKEMVLLKAFTGGKIPGLVGLEGVMEEGGWTYVFLTLYPHPLTAFQNPLPEDLVVNFFRKLLHTVQTLHALDVSHEDIKRANIMVEGRNREDFHPVLVDFGFSHFEPDRERGVRSLGGTFDYSSPEKVADRRYNPRANEVWSLGVLLLKMLDLPHPYVDRADPTETTKMAKARIINGDARWQWRDKDAISGAADLIQGMMDHNLERRLTIAQVLEHPYMQDPYSADPPTVAIPPMRLSTKVGRPVSPVVIQDLSFLAYTHNRFRLCESSKMIEARLYGREPCWEQRWAVMLAAWEQHAEIDWEDLPIMMGERKSKSLPVRLRPIPSLRYINMSPVAPPAFKEQPTEATELVSDDEASVTAVASPSPPARPHGVPTAGGAYHTPVTTPRLAAAKQPKSRTKAIATMKGKENINTYANAEHTVTTPAATPPLTHGPTPKRMVLGASRNVNAGGGVARGAAGVGVGGVKPKRPNAAHLAGMHGGGGESSTQAHGILGTIPKITVAGGSRVPRLQKAAGNLGATKKRPNAAPPAGISTPDNKVQTVALLPPPPTKPQPRRSPRFA